LRKLFVLLFSVLVGCGLFGFYLLSGFADQDTQVDYQVNIEDPASGIMDVSMTLYPSKRLFVDLFLRDTKLEGRKRVSDLHVSRGEMSLPYWQTVPFYPDFIRIGVGFEDEPIRVTYKVDPLWNKGTASPVSYLGSDFGYLRVMVSLYTPFTLFDLESFYKHIDSQGPQAGMAEAAFSLPEGWQLVSPWGSGQITAPVADFRNTYLGVGPLLVIPVQAEESLLLLAFHEGLPREDREKLQKEIPLIFSEARRLTGFAPRSRAPAWSLTILPEEPIYGGAAGTNSLVADWISLPLVAHEIFHWWNGKTIEYSASANWIEEGFTTYYEAKLLVLAGFWQQEMLSVYFEDKAHLLEKENKQLQLDLVASSEKLTRRHNPEDYVRVYYGGALLAYYLDRRLMEQGQSLDSIWAELHPASGPITSESFFRELETLGGAELAELARQAASGILPIPIP
jgi:hypothetical protein